MAYLYQATEPKSGRSQTDHGDEGVWKTDAEHGAAIAEQLSNHLWAEFPGVMFFTCGSFTCSTATSECNYWLHKSAERITCRFSRVAKTLWNVNSTST